MAELTPFQRGMIQIRDRHKRNIKSIEASLVADKEQVRQTEKDLREAKGLLVDTEEALATLGITEENTDG